MAPDCGPDSCYESESEGRMRVAKVYAASRGQCRVTIEFSDGCQPATLTFSFRGPMENCCEDVCARAGGGGRLPASCAEP